MYKIVACFLFSTVLAKLYNPKDDYIHEWFNNLEEYRSKTTVPNAKAWVLSLTKDEDALKLRQVSEYEEREVFGAQIDEGPSQHQPSTNKIPKNSSKPAPIVDEKATPSDIIKVINKFVLTTHNEADVNIDKAGSLPTVKLYFKGAQTCLVVRAEGRQWNYIIRHSLFPEWFNEEHEPERDAIGPYVDVPKSVASEFYNVLFHY